MSAYGEYRLIEAIVTKLQSTVTLSNLLRDQMSTEYAKGFKIGAALPNVKGRTPYVAVSAIRTVPMTAMAQHTGWLRSTIKICVFSRDDLVCTLIGDAIIDEVIHKIHGMSPNRAYNKFFHCFYQT